MPELTDPRREKFAQLLAADLRQRPKKSRWHREAGFSGDSGNACTMSQEPEIMARVAEIRAQLPEVMEPAVLGPVGASGRGEKVTRESMTADIDEKIRLAQAAHEWPTVSALTATKAKLHGLLLQEQAAAEGGAQLSDAALLEKMVAHSRATGARVEPWQFMRMMGMRDANGNIAGPFSPARNGHAKVLWGGGR